MVFIFWKPDSGASFLRTFILALTILYQIETTKAEAPYNSIGNATVVRQEKSCYNKQNPLIQIWFRDAKPPFPLISVCYDDTNLNALWSVHQIFGEKMKNKENGSISDNPKWRQDEIDMIINVQASYNRFREAITHSGVNITKYNNFSSNYIEKGHLAPRRDQLTVAEMNATFYFINASPQWKSINGGNWNKLEMKVRELAETNSATFTVWTGSYGILKLETESAGAAEIWLGKDTTGKFVQKVPINRLTWKVIHDPEKSTAVAFVVVNNPWINLIPEEDILCEDICDKLKWVDWNRTNIVEGYTYCCTVNSLYEKVKYAPNLGNLPLLFSNSVVTTAPLSISLLLVFTFVTFMN